MQKEPQEVPKAMKMDLAEVGHLIEASDLIDKAAYAYEKRVPYERRARRLLTMCAVLSHKLKELAHDYKDSDPRREGKRARSGGLVIDRTGGGVGPHG